MKGQWIVDELRQMASWGGLDPRQLRFFKAQLDAARLVQCVRLEDVFTPEELAIIRAEFHPQKKECYKNATDFITFLMMRLGLYDAQYVEGNAESSVLSIEHAWNKVRGKYVDVTFELLFGEDNRERGYVALVELPLSELVEIQAENGYYGDTFRTLYIKSLKNNGEVQS